MFSITIGVLPLLTLQNEAAGSRPDSPPLALILQSLWATLSLQPFIFSSPHVQVFISSFYLGLHFFLLSRASFSFYPGLHFFFLSRASFFLLSRASFSFYPGLHFFLLSRASFFPSSRASFFPSIQGYFFPSIQGFIFSFYPGLHFFLLPGLHFFLLSSRVSSPSYRVECLLI